MVLLSRISKEFYDVLIFLILSFIFFIFDHFIFYRFIVVGGPFLSSLLTRVTSDVHEHPTSRADVHEHPLFREHQVVQKSLQQGRASSSDVHEHPSDVHEHPTPSLELGCS